MMKILIAGTHMSSNPRYRSVLVLALAIDVVIGSGFQPATVLAQEPQSSRPIIDVHAHYAPVDRWNGEDMRKSPHDNVVKAIVSGPAVDIASLQGFNTEVHILSPWTAGYFDFETAN